MIQLVDQSVHRVGMASHLLVLYIRLSGLRVLTRGQRLGDARVEVVVAHLADRLSGAVHDVSCTRQLLAMTDGRLTVLCAVAQDFVHLFTQFLRLLIGGYKCTVDAAT